MKPSVVFAAVVLGASAVIAFGQQPWTYVKFAKPVGPGDVFPVSQRQGEGSYEGLVKDMLGSVDQLTKVLKTIKDRDSAEAARPELKKTAHMILDLKKKAEDLKQPNKEEKDRLEKVYAPKFETAVKQLNELAVIIKGIPGGEDAVKELAILKDKIIKEKDKDKKDGAGKDK